MGSLSLFVLWGQIPDEHGMLQLSALLHRAASDAVLVVTTGNRKDKKEQPWQTG